MFLSWDRAEEGKIATWRVLFLVESRHFPGLLEPQVEVGTLLILCLLFKTSHRVKRVDAGFAQ